MQFAPRVPSSAMIPSRVPSRFPAIISRCPPSLANVVVVASPGGLVVRSTMSCRTVQAQLRADGGGAAQKRPRRDQDWQQHPSTQPPQAVISPRCPGAAKPPWPEKSIHEATEMIDPPDIFISGGGPVAKIRCVCAEMQRASEHFLTVQYISPTRRTISTT